MSHVRITALRADGRFVDRPVEIGNDQRVEVALAKAWAGVLGRPCAAREIRPEQPPAKGCVTLHAYNGPRVRAGDPEALAAAGQSRVIGRFDVLAAARARKRGEGGWHGAGGELPAPGRRP